MIIKFPLDGNEINDDLSVKTKEFGTNVRDHAVLFDCATVINHKFLKKTNDAAKIADDFEITDLEITGEIA